MNHQALIPSLMGLYQAKKATSGFSGGTPTFDDSFNNKGFGGGNNAPQTSSIQDLLRGIPTGKGAAGGAALKPYNELQAEELESWKKSSNYDPNSERGAANQYANWYNTSVQADPNSAQMQTQGAGPTSGGNPQPQAQPSAAPQQTPTSGGQQGGTIWDKLSGAGSKAWGGLKQWDKDFTQRAQNRGYMEKPESASAPETPWSIKDMPDDQWYNRDMGIMFDPNDPKMKEKMMKAAMDDGRLDPERYQQISRYQADVKSNPFYEQQKDKHYEGYSNKFDSWIGRMLNTGDKHIQIPRGN